MPYRLVMETSNLLQVYFSSHERDSYWIFLVFNALLASKIHSFAWIRLAYGVHRAMVMTFAVVGFGKEAYDNGTMKD